jgi:hypothetical protein
MSALTRAETERTQWRYDGTLPGIMAKLEDSGREIGLWVGDPGWGYTGTRITVYAKGANNRTTFSVELKPEDARRLAESIMAMADLAERQAA